MTEEHKKARCEYFNAQVRELLTRYGQIDLLWFDGTLPSLDGAITIYDIRKLQPHIIVNDRLCGVGDYCSRFECKLPTENRPPLGKPRRYGTSAADGRMLKMRTNTARPK